MRIEIWFDYNKKSIDAINNLNKALLTFRHKEDVVVFCRSNVIVESNFILHEIYHYGRKKGFNPEFLLDIFKYEDELGQLYEKYNINIEELNLAISNNETKKIVLNQKEHSLLQKIENYPTITMSHKFRIINDFSVENIKNHLIKMYEKESGITYCDEGDCIR